MQTQNSDLDSVADDRRTVRTPASLATLLGKALNTIARTRELSLLIILIITITVMNHLSQYFLTTANFRAIAVGFSPAAIISVGMAILLVSGGFDLSVGAVLALIAVPVVGEVLLVVVPVVDSSIRGKVDARRDQRFVMPRSQLSEPLSSWIGARPPRPVLLVHEDRAFPIDVHVGG